MIEESEEYVSGGFEEWIRQVSAENDVAVKVCSYWRQSGLEPVFKGTCSSFFSDTEVSFSVQKNPSHLVLKC